MGRVGVWVLVGLVITTDLVICPPARDSPFYVVYILHPREGICIDIIICLFLIFLILACSKMFLKQLFKILRAHKIKLNS